MAGQHRIETSVLSTYTNNRPLSEILSSFVALWLQMFSGSAESLMICLLLVMRLPSRSRLLSFKRNPTCRLVVFLDLLLQSQQARLARAASVGFQPFCLDKDAVECARQASRSAWVVTKHALMTVEFFPCRVCCVSPGLVARLQDRPQDI